MTAEITNAEKIRKLPWNIGFNAGNNIFAQLIYFGPTFVLFLSSLSLSNTEIGFLLSIMPFFGVIALFVAPYVARFGYKRTYLITFNLRNIVTMGLLITPTVMTHFGADASVTLVTVIIMGFAFFRAIGDTALIPWGQEYIPNSIRGKHAAINDMVSRVTSIATVIVAGYILGLSDGIERFIILFAIGIIAEFFAAYSIAQLPGGLPNPNSQSNSEAYRHIFDALRDRNFMGYIAGLALVTVAGAPLGFLPLFLQNQVGMSDSAIVLLQIGSIIGGFSATYLLGWASDRYGSKPVMLSGLYIKALLPLCFFLIPRNSELSLPIALGIWFIWGIFEIAWAIGSGRMLYVNVVPTEKKTEYMAVYYASIGLIGGISQIGSGSLLDLFSGISGNFLGIELDAFAPLFFMAILLNVFAIIFFSRVKVGASLSVGEFAGMFTHGNPIIALQSLVRYHRITDERATVVTTERMGQTKSLLTVDELLEALKDPRFNVRFEAIISIARMRSDPRLIEALAQIVDGTEISLSVVSAWALGRMDDENALPVLRDGLNSSYRSMQAHCARALGTLGDTTVAPLLLERLQKEEDKGLIVAYSSALGNLHYEDALDTLLVVLKTMQNEGARMELALAVARVVGDEPYFIRLLRNIRQDPGTNLFQALNTLKRKLDKTTSSEVKQKIDEAANLFAKNELDAGAVLLSEIIHALYPRDPSITAEPHIRVLQECAQMLSQIKAERTEYLVLSVCVLQTE